MLALSIYNDMVISKNYIEDCGGAVSSHRVEHQEISSFDQGDYIVLVKYFKFYFYSVINLRFFMIVT